MLEGLTPEQRERARVVCEVFGVTLEELEALDQADGYSAARLGLPDDARLEWVTDA